MEFEKYLDSVVLYQKLIKRGDSGRLLKNPRPLLAQVNLRDLSELPEKIGVSVGLNPLRMFSRPSYDLTEDLARVVACDGNVIFSNQSNIDLWNNVASSLGKMKREEYASLFVTYGVPFHSSLVLDEA